MPFKHGAVNGFLDGAVHENVVVVRSCSWSCCYCVLARFKPKFLASLQRMGVPSNDIEVLKELSRANQFPPWYSGDRMTVMRSPLENPDGAPTERLAAMQVRLCARGAAWDDCV
eukprot:13238448-Alexandrium_andersonii.AAC.1